MNLRTTLTTLLVVSLLAGTATAGSAGHVASTTNPAVQSPLLFQSNDANSSVSFNRSIYEVEQGETATMNLSLEDMDAMTVQLGGGAMDYKLNASVTDSNGDGTVVLVFDTAKAGSDDGSALTTKADADELTVKNETKVDGELPANMYGITVYAGIGDSAPTIGYGGLNVQGDESNTSRTATTTDTTTTPDESGEGMTTTTTSNESTTTTDSSGQPGFGVEISVVALAAVALLTRRQ
jgi:PGF-CTERM protein